MSNCLFKLLALRVDSLHSGRPQLRSGSLRRLVGRVAPLPPVNLRPLADVYVTVQYFVFPELDETADAERVHVSPSNRNLFIFAYIHFRRVRSHFPLPV